MRTYIATSQLMKAIF